MTGVAITALTHRGLVRDHNEDSIGWAGMSLSGNMSGTLHLESPVTGPAVLVVCDGMGGHAGGAEAARMACELLTEPDAVRGGTPDEIIASLRGAIQATSDAINDRARDVPELAGMGCTVVGVVLHPDEDAIVFNIGDSRCYRLEDRYLAQLTVDHRRPGGNTLLQALGGGTRVILEPDFFACPVPTGTGLLLCTDGLDDYADASAIEQAMLADEPDLPGRLRDLALHGGGGDNVTLVQVVALPQRPAPTRSDPLRPQEVAHGRTDHHRPR